MLSTQPYKGARDFFPEDIAVRNYIFETWRKVCTSFGFEEYDGPFLEPFELFASKTGEEIVNEQLYSFTDRGERKVAIRPEMTPTVSRMAAEKIRSQSPTPIKWFSIANFWRYERPQKGRGREFYQLNVDIFGEDSVEADLELLLLNQSIMKAFKAEPNMYQIRVNNRYLINYLFENYLGVDSKETHQQIAKAIDKKAKIPQEAFEELLSNAGLNSEQIEKTNKILSFELDDLRQIKDLPIGAQQLIRLFDLVKENKIPSVVYDPTVVRGFDYYDGNVFEQFDMTEGNNRSMFGGGRYDGLISLFIDQKIPAVGFAPGDITLLDFLISWNLLPTFKNPVDVFVTVFPKDNECKNESYTLSQKLRDAGLNVEITLNPNLDLSKQIKFADKKGVKNVAIIGQEELSQNKFVIKNLESGTQKTYDYESIRELVFDIRG